MTRRLLIISLLVVITSLSASAATKTKVLAEGPFKSLNIFSKEKSGSKGGLKLFKKKKKTKYFKLMAKKQRKARWHRRSLLRANSISHR